MTAVPFTIHSIGTNWMAAECSAHGVKCPPRLTCISTPKQSGRIPYHLCLLACSQVVLDNFLGFNQSQGTTTSKGAAVFQNIAPSVVDVNPAGKNGSGVCIDSVTNTRMNFNILQPIASIPGAGVNPISALALSVIAAHRNAMESDGANITVTPMQIPDVQDLTIPEFSSDIFTTCWEIMGFNESALGVNFTSMSGVKLQTGQAVRVATAAASGQLLGLVSIGTSFVGNMKRGPPAQAVAKHFLRATTNAAIANLGATSKVYVNLALKATIKAVFMDSIRGAFGEMKFLAEEAASGGSKRRLLQMQSGATLDPFTDGTFDASQIAALTSVVDVLSTTLADTNTRLDTAKQAAITADSTNAATFDMVATLTSIASVSSVQQNSIAQAVAQLAAVASDPATAAQINSTLSSFSSSFSAAALDSKITAAASTLNMAEIKALATPPANTTTTTTKPKKKASNGWKIGVGVGVGIGGGLLIAAVGGFVLMKRRGTQTVVSGAQNA
jgi:hypothetical protein